jgi:hypothetical protein
MGRHVASMGKTRNAYKIMVGKSEGRRVLGRHRCRWQDDIRMYVREIGCLVVDWIHVT